MDLDNALRTAQESMHRPVEPLWKGPEVDGITFSLLSRWLVCRERFRLYAIEGLRPRDDFNHRISYGSMWHVCEEAAEAERSQFDGELCGTDTTLWQDNLADYCQRLCTQYPLRQADILKWVQVCAVQFPAYVRYWATHPDTVSATNLMKEDSFRVPYRLPSGRTVVLRGKRDSVDFLPAHRDGNRDYPDGIWLQENKTKGDIDPASIRRQLRMDLQTNLYIVALQFSESPLSSPSVGLYDLPVLGVRYNVVRRPLSGGRHSIVQHKATSKKMAETDAEFYDRLGGLIAGEPEYFFMRWKCDVAPSDVERFRRTCLDPILEQLCDWYDHIIGRGCIADGNQDAVVVSRTGLHYTYPYGVWNPLLEGGTGDVDEYLATGSLAGLQRTTNLFPELT